MRFLRIAYYFCVCSAIAASAQVTTLKPAMAAPAKALDQASGRYLTCLSQLKQDPTAAYDQANAWRRQEASASAYHCEALALIELGSYRAGARILSNLAIDEETGDTSTRATLHGQAGNAWILQQDSQKALTSFEAALALKPLKPWVEADLLVDRSAARALEHDWSGAEKDCSLALEILPQLIEAVIARAGARRMLKDPVGALADIEFALAIEPESVDALVERGLLRKDYNDPDGARKDFEDVIAMAPSSSAATLARNGLAKLSIRDINN
jgi:tetratricopeptide (TPR) repeat protein